MLCPQYNPVYVENLEFRFQVNLIQSVLAKTVQIVVEVTEVTNFLNTFSTAYLVQSEVDTSPVHIVLLLSGYRTDSLFHLYIVRKSSTQV